MSFLRRTPFLRLLWPVVTGILLYNHAPLPAWSLPVLGTVAVVCVAASWIVRPVPLQYRHRWLFGCGISAFFIVLSYLLCGQAERRKVFEPVGKEGLFLVELVRPPLEKERSYQCEVQVLLYADSAATVTARGRGYVYLPKDERDRTPAFGDRLWLRTTFAPPAPAGNPSGFDYARYLKRKGIGATAYVPATDWQRVGRNESHSVMALAQQCRSRFLDLFRRFGFTPDNQAVLSALAFGHTDELTSDLREGYNTSGITHILAVSGLHVGIIYVILRSLLGFLNRSAAQRRAKAVIILAALWGYAFITGLPPSAFRATLMFTLVAIGTLFDRKAYLYNTIFMSAFFMLLIDPDLLFQVGFQLSYAAVLGIVGLREHIAGLVHCRSRFVRRIWELTSVSVAAQLGTLPFTLYYFQTFPNYFLLSNLIAIPATSVILYLAVLLLATASVPVVSTLTASLLNATLSLLNATVDLVQSLPHPVSVIAINLPQALLMVTAAALLALYIRSRKYPALIGCLSCVAAFLLVNTAIRHDTARTHRLIVYSAYRNTHVNFISGGENLVLTSDSADLTRTAAPYWRSRKIAPPRLPDRESELIGFCGKKIFILRDNFCNTHTARRALPVDYLIIGYGAKPKARELAECFRPQHIIADHTVTPWYTRQLQDYCRAHDIPFHSTREDGAFIADFE